MSGNLAEYARYFQEGSRVRVGVPLADGGVFHESGVVCHLDGDLLELELSRDVLPQQAILELGLTLELGLLDRDVWHSCRAMVAGEPEQHRLLLRLIEGIVPFEPREFFRQDVYLPLDYRIPPDQLFEEIAKRWRESRREMEFAAQRPEPGEAAELGALREEIKARLEKGKVAPPAAANISGGGVRLDISEQLQPDMLIELTIYLPQPQRVLEIVGEVVDVRPVPGETRFSTALRFRLIDEADRDRLIGFITARQLSQLSQHAHQGTSRTSAERPRGHRRLRLAIGIALLVALVAWEARVIVQKRERGEKHEIERIFEKAVQEYLTQRQ